MMNNEPVAWRTHYPSGWEYKDGNPPFELKGNSQLLYAHPVKELTDEEIMAKADETCLTAWIAINPIMDVESQKEIAKKRIVEFARAILRKAQEK